MEMLSFEKWETTWWLYVQVISLPKKRSKNLRSTCFGGREISWPLLATVGCHQRLDKTPCTVIPFLWGSATFLFHNPCFPKNFFLHVFHVQYSPTIVFSDKFIQWPISICARWKQMYRFFGRMSRRNFPQKLWIVLRNCLQNLSLLFHGIGKHQYK